MRTIVFGDTGGHGKQLLASLAELGLDFDTLKLPEDVTVVHLGDLIHKGPNSNQLVHFVNSVMAANPGRWIQLFGNHELHHVPEAPKFWNCDCDLHTVTTLNSWLDSGQAKLTWALDDFSELQFGSSPEKHFAPEVKRVLFSHAGMTRMFWREMGEHESAVATARATNAVPMSQVSRPGVMLRDPSKPANRIHRPGPAWALAHSEVFSSWTDTVMPFAQIHGHSTGFSWTQHGWFSSVPQMFADSTELYPQERVSVTHLGENLMLGIDPGFDKSADLPQQPYLTFTL